MSPTEVEYLDEEDNLEFGVHHYITGVHQPLIVRRKREVTGLLRLADVLCGNQKKNHQLRLLTHFRVDLRR